MPLDAIACGFANGVVAEASVQYVKMSPGLLPAVTDGLVISTVEGSHTGSGFVIINTGEVSTFNIRVAIVSQPEGLPLIVVE